MVDAQNVGHGRIGCHSTQYAVLNLKRRDFWPNLTEVIAKIHFSWGGTFTKTAPQVMVVITHTKFLSAWSVSLAQDNS